MCRVVTNTGYNTACIWHEHSIPERQRRRVLALLPRGADDRRSHPRLSCSIDRCVIDHLNNSKPCRTVTEAA